MTSSLTNEELLETLLSIRRDAARLEDRCTAELDALPPAKRASGANLLHYLAIRSVDLREEQRALARRGLSSLGRAEPHVLATLDAVIARLAKELGRDLDASLPDHARRGPTADDAVDRLMTNATEALGEIPAERDLRVMVTLPTEAASDSDLVDRLVGAGMTVARINCAHDDGDAWRRMVEHVQRAADRHRRRVRVSFDLAGPKLRTGDLEHGPAVYKLKPRRDALGRTTDLARVRLVATSVARLDGDVPEIPVDGAVAQNAEPGDELHLRDARGRRRRLPVERAIGTTVEAVSDRTTYVVPGLSVSVVRNGSVIATGEIGAVPPIEGRIDLNAGDTLEIRCGAGRGAPGTDVAPASVWLDVPEVFAAVREGERVLIDDGKIEGIVREVSSDRIALEIVRPARAKLRPEKGINLPDTRIEVAALTDDDRAALDVVAPLADLVSLSFVSAPDDIDQLRDELEARARPDVGVVLKIEHRQAFEALPDILMRALHLPAAAVMVARGDLAVEVGYERLAEVQEEILLLCEAAHVPVIWATQVLESLAKHGSPTRAEITDAAFASRSECVMLNKGPYIADTIEALDDIVGRMRGHLDKRTPMLRRLAVAESAATRSDP